VQTGSGAYSPSYPVGSGAFPPGEKRSGLEADHLSLSVVEVKDGGATPSLPHMYSRHIANEARGKFYLIRRGADKSLAFPIFYFPICSTTETIFLGWVKEVRTTKS
jgi:hypothetical protein